ncbi:tetratricopeptide repeat protein [Croceicoccus sp. YJ47]|uniref:SPOR domain-containing protein n=1 Tax=Croceicoccus sp. YJ47 TaxID=2798724 RepID=UPI0019227641|nr:tetratricopeptide repeat protein [Croceicoccus sp. YJ47]QQN74880.1 tetratricopeptide repeat protein [Croceicoccus sp. YJ47]
MIDPFARTRNGARKLGLAVLGSAVLAGCSSFYPASQSTESQVASALAAGQSDAAIALAEGAVLARPDDAATRAMLGRAYLDAGRLVSAREALGDAVTLGDGSARTALMLALAQIGTGYPRIAVATIEAQGTAIPASERGLALALAGETARGVQILTDAIRAGDNSVRARQNLAYAFALDGRWRDARIMAAQDVPADRLDQRITHWAMTARPDLSAQRIAGLLGTTLAENDRGQPMQLALKQPQAPAFANAPAPNAIALNADGAADMPRLEAPAIATAPMAALPAPIGLSAAPNVEAKAAPRSAAVVSVRAPAALPQAGAGGSHVAQLGSFLSMADARAGWAVFQSRYANLRGVMPAIGTARVAGRTYYRVGAAGFDAQDAARMCQAVKAGGHGCLPIARERLGTPLRPTRMASAR